MSDLQSAMSRLDDFMAQHLGDDDGSFDVAIRADATELGEATIAVLRALYAEGRSDLDASAWTGVAGLVLCASSDVRKRFVSDVLFDVTGPPVYAELASLIRAAFPSGELKQALLFGLRSADPRRRTNARALPYHVLGKRGDVELTPLARAEIVAAGRVDDADFDIPQPGL